MATGFEEARTMPVVACGALTACIYDLWAFKGRVDQGQS